MANVWSELSRGCLAFTHTHADAITTTTFKDTGSLIQSLLDQSPPGVAKARLEQLKNAVIALTEETKPVIDAVELEAAKAKTAVANMATELATNPFAPDAASRAATELANVILALEAAIDIIAKNIAAPEPSAADRQNLEDAVSGIKEPWIASFRGGAATSAGFDSLCKTLLRIDNAGKQFVNGLAWSRDNKRLALTLSSAETVKIDALNFDDTSVEAFFDYKTDAKVGVAVRTNLRAGLGGDKLLEKIIPDPGAAASTNSIAVTLDSKDGLTFGDGPNREITLPARFNSAGVEIREMAISRPIGKQENDGSIDLTVTIAGKFGDALGIIAEGGGVIIQWKGEPGAAFEVLPKPPESAALRIQTGIVSGGGYLRYSPDRSEYGGILDLKFTEIGIWGAGLISPDPFSFVVVMGIHFLPKIELSFGFTLNGLGGILAIDRQLASDELRKSIREGAVDQILFPDDPVAAAPKILDRIGQIFPPKQNGFVVGPIAELGWGSQTGFVRAKVGVVLAIPDPRIVVLGSLQVVVPSIDVAEELRIVDLRLEVVAEFTPDYIWIGGSLVNSKMAGITLTGDMGLLIRWNGGAVFALSAGGFFPKYVPPPEMAGMRRVTLELSPPIAFLQVRAEAYFAITSNSVQFGGKVTITADLDPAEGKAWVGVDALFQWSPRFYFIFLIDAGIEIKAFGETVAGISFRGELSGMKPWHLEGHASATILLWDVPVDIGPIEWGDRDVSTAPPISPAHLAAEALGLSEAWKPELPAGADSLARFLEDNTTPLLVHPLGKLEVKQLRVPLETDIDRIGSSPVTSHRVYLVDPKVGTLDAAAVSQATDFFAPGHFRNLTEDQQTSRPAFEEFPCGMKVAASVGATFGASMSVTPAWETVYPHETFERQMETWSFGKLATVALHSNAVSASARLRGNPYLPQTSAPDDGSIKVAPAGLVRILRRDDLSAVAQAAEVMTTAAASSRLPEFGALVEEVQLVSAGGTI